MLELLKQRRIWAGVTAIIAFIITSAGYSQGLDTNSLTDAILQLINAISGLAAIILPIWSYYKPK